MQAQLTNLCVYTAIMCITWVRVRSSSGAVGNLNRLALYGHPTSFLLSVWVFMRTQSHGARLLCTCSNCATSRGVLDYPSTNEDAAALLRRYKRLYLRISEFRIFFEDAVGSSWGQPVLTRVLEISQRAQMTHSIIINSRSTSVIIHVLLRFPRDSRNLFESHLSIEI